MNGVLFSSDSCEWETPRGLFDELDREFHFTLDPCSTHENAKCEKHYTRMEDGLIQDWTEDVVFCNPPYGRTISKWVQKAYESSKGGAVVVVLVPARTDTKWFHDWVYGKAELRFLRGRLTFGKARNPAPFPSMIAVYRGEATKCTY